MIRKAVAALALAISLSGCMGHNALTAKALKYNLTTAEGRWSREGLLFFNSIEFWTVTNPLNDRSALVDLPISRYHEPGLDNVELARVERLDEQRANLFVEFENGDRVTFDVVRERDAYTISYGGGEFFRGSLKL